MSGECDKCGNHCLECQCICNQDVTAHTWVSVKDRLPPLDEEVIVAMFDHRPKVQMYFVFTARRFKNHS